MADSGEDWDLTIAYMLGAEKANDTIKELRSALAAREAECERLRSALAWQPIETAPKDGTPFLAWNGHWRGVAMYFEARYEEDPEWVDEQTNYIEPEPTHWMPLPTPPKGGE